MEDDPASVAASHAAFISHPQNVADIIALAAVFGGAKYQRPALRLTRHERFTELRCRSTRWSGTLEPGETVKVAASIKGAIWFVKSQSDALQEVVMTVETKTERLTMDFPGQDKRSIFEPARTLVMRLDGTIIQARTDVEKSFEGHQQTTPWDEVHVAYFSGEALWTYLNTPFLYTREGFATEEISSIQEDGETWRRLKVRFPVRVKSHSKEQISFFGSDGLLRRHDYPVDILGGAKGLNYAFEYRDVDGIIVPTKRRVYAYEGDYRLVPEPLLVSIDMGEIIWN